VTRTLEVWADWLELGGARPMGRLTADVVRGREVFRFTYDDAWLAGGEARQLDPRLALGAGAQFPPSGQVTFGVFLDSCPDRWGRVLLDRREAARARIEGRSPRRLLESDYLLGVYDGHRLGALRFSAEHEGRFLDDDDALASPPWTSLRELEHVSRRLEEDGAAEQPEYLRWLTMLVAPGRSLGGARPKASVVDPDGALWIAKFPSRDDDHDVGAWEMVAHRIAERAGVDVASARCERFASRHHTFLARRFDRVGEARRHFASAMTHLERADGESEGASYLELAEVLIRHGAQPQVDLEQLWRRIVLFVAISNVDDHLRNHGFLLDRRGWLLAPAYDVNPVPWGEGLTLAISETDNAQELELVMEVAPYFRVSPARARSVRDEVLRAARGWREVATELGLDRTEQERMARAFRVADASA
jgi:serine/threonine-protein kinase HipA